MTGNVARTIVRTVLEAAGWEQIPPGRSSTMLKHASGIVWEAEVPSGGCFIDLLNGVSIPFARTAPDAVVLAACLAATGQLDPTQQRVDLEERADWLGWLEAAGVDNWPGIDVAREMRAGHSS